MKSPFSLSLNENNNILTKSSTLSSNNPLPLAKNSSNLDSTHQLFQYQDNNSQNSQRLQELLSKTNNLLSNIGLDSPMENPFYNNIHSPQSSRNIPVKNISIISTLPNDNNLITKTIDSKEPPIEEHKSNQPSLNSYNYKEPKISLYKEDYFNNKYPTLDNHSMSSSDIDKLTQCSLEDQVKILFKANLYFNEEIKKLHHENSELRNELSSYRLTTQSCTNSQFNQKENNNNNELLHNNILEENNKLKKLNKKYEQEINELKLKMKLGQQQHNKKHISNKNSKKKVTEHNDPIFINHNEQNPQHQRKKSKSRMKKHELILNLPKEQQHSSHNELIFNNKTVTISSTLRDDEEGKETKRKLNSNNDINLKEQNEFNKKLSRKIILENDNQQQPCSSYYNMEDNTKQLYSKPKRPLSHKRKRKTTKSHVNNKLQFIPDPNTKCYYDYYGNNTERTRVCYACLFGLNQNSKGYSPLMCSSRTISPSNTLSSRFKG